MITNIVYLHGLASSPASKKANIFKAPLVARGAHYVVPDLNVPSFEKLTLTAMLEKVAETVRALPDGPIILIGSSLGGLAALHFADRYQNEAAKRVDKLILLAPALDFVGNRLKDDTMLDQWRQQGFWLFYNYAQGKPLPVHFGLVEDIAQYDSYTVALAKPILIYHGRNDASVPYEYSVRFAEGRPYVTLELLDSDHELLDQTDIILDGILRFADLPR